MEIDNARQLVNQAEEAFVAAKQALDNPDNDQQKTTLVNKAALLTLRTTAGLLEDVGDRLQALETTVHDKPSKQEVEHMLEAYASESQKAQRKVEQKVDAKIKVLKDLFDKKIKALEASRKRGAEGGASGSGASGSGASGSRPAKKERQEYEAYKYTFMTAAGDEKSLEEASFEDIKEPYRLVKAAKDEGRIDKALTLTPANLKKWRIDVDQAKVPRNKASGRYIHLSSFLKEGLNKAGQVALANGELDAVPITN